MMMKIIVLLCDVFEDIMPFEDISYNSMIKDLFEPHVGKVKFEYYEAFARDLPNAVEEDAIYLIPGSRFDSYADIPWLNELRDFIEELHDEKAKMIGICFGHQLIAETLGGRVEKAFAGMGLGVREAEIINPSLAKGIQSGKFILQNYHQDQVVMLPENGELIASSSFCPIEAYSIDKHIICVQGYPEFSSDYMRFLIRKHSFNVSETVRMKALKSLENETNGAETVKLMLQFLNIN